MLVVAVGVALLWANSPWGSTYATVWGHSLSLGGTVFADFTTVQSWVNGGLMAVFFFVVGLEIGREHRTGELGHLRTAVVPVVGAAGGMAGAGLVFVVFNHGGVGSSGWGIPMATDIAFALGALALLGRRVPPGLRLLLLTLAVADDVGSVLVLAIFYSARTHPVALIGALLVTLLMVAARQWSGLPAWPVLLGGVAVWVLLAAGGVEPALAGVVAGVLVPSRRAGRQGNPAGRLERRTAPVSAFVILPLFALANAGIVFHMRDAGSPRRHRGVHRDHRSPGGREAAGDHRGLLPGGPTWPRSSSRGGPVESRGGRSCGSRHRLHRAPAHRRAGVLEQPTAGGRLRIGPLGGFGPGPRRGGVLLVVVRRRMDLSDALAARPSLGSAEEPFIPW